MRKNIDMYEVHKDCITDIEMHSDSRFFHPASSTVTVTITILEKKLECELILARDQNQLMPECMST